MTKYNKGWRRGGRRVPGALRAADGAGDHLLSSILFSYFLFFFICLSSKQSI